MKVKKSIAIIGEGITEWFYIDSLRVACRYPFKVAPDFPQHSDIPHMAKLVESYVDQQYDYVVCLVDMDRLLSNPTEMATYRRTCKKSSQNVIWIETNPCTEFWFLLHFLQQAPIRRYASYAELQQELRKHMPGYEKTQHYFRRTNLYRYLTETGDIEQAKHLAETLARMNDEAPEDSLAYSQMFRLLNLLAELNEDDSEETLKSENQKQNGDKRQKILDFLADFGISDAKTISKAIGLKASRTREYLKLLADEGRIVTYGEYNKRKYGLNKEN